VWHSRHALRCPTAVLPREGTRRVIDVRWFAEATSLAQTRQCREHAARDEEARLLSQRKPDDARWCSRPRGPVSKLMRTAERHASMRCRREGVKLTGGTGRQRLLVDSATSARTASRSEGHQTRRPHAVLRAASDCCPLERTRRPRPRSRVDSSARTACRSDERALRRSWDEESDPPAPREHEPSPSSGGTSVITTSRERKD